MHSTQTNTWLPRIALVVLSATTLLASGCARMYHMTHYNALGLLAADHHRSYFHSEHTGRIIAKEHGHFCTVEPPCFGFQPTCWNPWPAGCPQQCTQPCLADTPVLMEEVASPQQSVVAPEEMPQEPPEEGPAPVPAEDESILPPDDFVPPLDDSALPADVDSFPSEPSTRSETNRDEDAGWSEAEPTWDADDDEAAPPLQKQPLAEQLTDEPLLPIAEKSCPTSVWDANIARREIDQMMVMVEENGEPLDDVSDAEVDPPTPQLAEAEVRSTTEQDSKTTARLEARPVDPIADADETQPERLALRTETVDRPLPPRASREELPVDTSVRSAASEPVSVPAEAIPAPKAGAPIAETTTGAAKVPSFKISAVMPPSRESREAATVISASPPHSTSNFTIRFASEGTSSLRVGAAKKTGTGTTSLRFR